MSGQPTTEILSPMNKWTQMKSIKIMPKNLFIHRVSTAMINSLRWIMTDHQLNYSRNIIVRLSNEHTKKKRRTNEFPINIHIGIGFVSFRLKWFRCEIPTASNWHESVFCASEIRVEWMKTNEKKKEKKKNRIIIVSGFIGLSLVPTHQTYMYMKWNVWTRSEINFRKMLLLFYLVTWLLAHTFKLPVYSFVKL